MKRLGKVWQILGFGLTSFLGVLSHFLYEWSGEKKIVGAFSGVNESTWEHMKLFFFPFLIFAIFQSVFFKEDRGFWCIKLRGALLGLLLIPVIFYTYNGAIGLSSDWINIAIFFISTAFVYIYESIAFLKSKNCNSKGLCIIALLTIAILFVLFTFVPPEIDLFKDPTNGEYGI